MTQQSEIDAARAKANAAYRVWWRAYRLYMGDHVPVNGHAAEAAHAARSRYDNALARVARLEAQA